MIIIVVGMPGSGKDLFVQTALGMGFCKIGMGDVVRHHASLANLDSGDASIGGFANDQRREHGPAIWADRTLQRMPPGNVIIDGSRSVDEIALFRERLGSGLRVVAITAPTEMRYRRLLARRRHDDPNTKRDFETRDEREKSWGLEEAIRSADITIPNEGGPDEFKTRCQIILERITSQKNESPRG